MQTIFRTMLLLFCAISMYGQEIDFNVFPAKFDPSAERFTELKKLLGHMPPPPPLDIDTLEIKEINGGRRLLIEYTAELEDSIFNTPIDRIRAYLFIPTLSKKKFPAIVAIHQDGANTHLGKLETAGLAGDGQLQYGLELFQRGYVVICPDRFYHADRRRIPRPDTICLDEDLEESAYSHWIGQLVMQGRTKMGKEVYDNMLAVNVLERYDFVDTARIGAIGHSGGGYGLVYFMFYDPRIKAGVSSCGFFELTYWFHENAALKRGISASLPGLLNYGIGSDYLAFIAPRPMLLTRGLYEWGDTGKWGRFSKLDVTEYQFMERYVSQAYANYGKSENLKFLYFDEEGGRHAIPPRVKKNIYGWLDAQLE
ncbi:MAG: prolyl oligopeptidase family serine peptidase [Bacteroidota bacterium]